MTRFYLPGIGSAAFLFVSAQGALADVTAKDVWANWQAYLSSTGYQVSANESMSGNALTLTDVVVSMAYPDDQGSVSMTMDQIVFTENGDGTVAIEMPDTFPMNVEAKEGGDPLFNATLAMTQTAQNMQASGDPDKVRYVYEADQSQVLLTALTIGGENVSRDQANFELTISGMSSDSTLFGASELSYTQAFKADQVAYDLVFKDPTTATDFDLKGQLQGIDANGSAKLPEATNSADFQAMIAAGFEFDGKIGYASGQSTVASSSDGQSFNSESTSSGGNIGVSLNGKTLTYDVAGTDSKISVTSSDLPFPVELALAESAFGLALPIAKSDTAQDFALSIKLGDFTMSEMLWGIFDPSQALPRDPASVVLDLAGKAKVLVDFMDPEIAEDLEQMDSPPGELDALTINQLLVSLAGAKLTGTGAFTFDNTSPSPFGAMPAPNGSVDLELVGANGLLDKLIAMGLVSDQDAMGARMMMGMLAVPGDAPDTLTSKIEINDQGHIIANGQRIQ